MDCLSYRACFPNVNDIPHFSVYAWRIMGLNLTKSFLVSFIFAVKSDMVYANSNCSLHLVTYYNALKYSASDTQGTMEWAEFITTSFIW